MHYGCGAFIAPNFAVHLHASLWWLVALDKTLYGREGEGGRQVLAAVEYYLGRGVVSLECPQELIRRRRKVYRGAAEAQAEQSNNNNSIS